MGHAAPALPSPAEPSARWMIILLFFALPLSAVDEMAWFNPPLAVGEGQGSVTVLVARIGAGSGAASVQVTSTNSSALAGSDYTALPATTLSWGAGQVGTRAVTVTILDDAVFENFEMFRLSLVSPVNATVPDPNIFITIDDDDPNPAGYLSVVTDDADVALTVSESAGTVPITVVRSGGTAGAISATFTLVDVTAAAGTDFQTPVSLVLNWGTGEGGAKTLSVPLINDNVAKPSRYFSANLGSLTGGVSYGPNTGALVTIIDDDQPTAGVLVVPLQVNVSEGAGSASITVVRAGGTQGAVGVSYATIDNSALAGSDYTTTSGTLSWAAGDGSARTITVPLIDDATSELTEYFGLQFSAPSGGLLLPSASPYVSFTVLDDDTTAGVIGFAIDYLNVDEAVGSVVLTAVRTGGSSGLVTVAYATSDVTAVAPTDYTTTSGTLTWADGDSAPQTIAIPVIDNGGLDLGIRYFDLVFSPPGGGAILAIDPLDGPTSARVVIHDNDGPAAGSLALLLTAETVDEGVGQVVATARRSGGSTGAVSASYSIRSWSATARDDYLAAADGTVSWADGDSADKLITIPIIDDAIAEGVETFSVSLGSPAGGAVIDGSAAEVFTIIDNDADTAGIVRFATPTVNVAENAGTATFWVTRSGGTGGAITVTCATVLEYPLANARDGIDFTATVSVLSWASGDGAAKSFTVPIIADHRPGPDRVFLVRLSMPTGGAILEDATGLPTSVATIRNLDVNTAGTIGFKAATQSVSEGAGSVVIDVGRIGGISGAVSVAYVTSYGTADEGVDYTTAVGTLNWAAGDATDKTITVSILDDVSVEGDEDFTLYLSQETGGALIGTATTTVTITDDEVNPAGLLAFTQATIAASETTAGTVTVRVARSGGTTGPVSVLYQIVDVGTTAGVDYTAVSNGILAWAGGDGADQTINVTIADDGVVEGAERLRLILSAPGGGATLGTALSEVTISDPAAAAPAASSDGTKCGGGGIFALMVLLTVWLGLSARFQRAPQTGRQQQRQRREP